MTASVASLWRHPIKSHGREELDRVTLTAGQTMPWDRTWAVAHQASKATNEAWSPCAAFTRVARAPALMAITCALNEATETVTLRHPDRPDLTVQPDAEAQVFLDWVAPLMPAGRAAPARLVRVPGRGMTDSDFPSVTLCNLASHRAVEQRLGRRLSIHRWRGSIWIDGLDLWQEFEWLDRDVRVGETVMRVRERTDRCPAITANPETGIRDFDVLGALEHWGHTDFSVRAEVVQGGIVSVGAPVKVI